MRQLNQNDFFPSLSHISWKYTVNCMFLSVEMYKGSTAAEKNKKSEYEHV